MLICSVGLLTILPLSRVYMTKLNTLYLLKFSYLWSSYVGMCANKACFICSCKRGLNTIALQVYTHNVGLSTSFTKKKLYRDPDQPNLNFSASKSVDRLFWATDISSIVRFRSSKSVKRSVGISISQRGCYCNFAKHDTIEQEEVFPP